MSVNNDLYSEAYKRRCLKALSEIGAPISGWKCRRVIDTEFADKTCELCNCEKVRFLHLMWHPEWFEDIEVGCICAGLMEGDVLAAVARDKEAKNRSHRRQNFYSKKWSRNCYGGKHYLHLHYKH